MKYKPGDHTSRDKLIKNGYNLPGRTKKEILYSENGQGDTWGNAIIEAHNERLRKLAFSSSAEFTFHYRIHGDEFAFLFKAEDQ